VNRRRALVALVAWLLLTLGLAIGGSRPAVVALAALVAAAGAAWSAVIDVGDAVESFEWGRRRRAARFEPTGGRWGVQVRHQLQRAAQTQSTELQEALVRLVDHRLLAHHRVDRRRDPAAADALLTPALRRLVAPTARPLTDVRELERLVTQIEAL
jgi:hypothetical protein